MVYPLGRSARWWLWPVVAAALSITASCGGGSKKPEHAHRTRLPVQFVRAPPALARRCSQVARAVGYPVPCPTRIPRRLFPTEVRVGPCRFEIVGVPCPPPGRWRGWVVGSSEVGGVPPQHLVIVASPEPIEDYAKVVNGPAWRPVMRVEVGGRTTINGWRARWIFVPPSTNEGSAFFGHVVLVWTNWRPHLRGRLPRHDHSARGESDGRRARPAPPTRPARLRSARSLTPAFRHVPRPRTRTPSSRRSRSVSSFHQPTDARRRSVPGRSRTTTPRS